jgi:flagellar secretion chaperone FliS
MIWKQAYLETRILSADPMELVTILYESALESVAAAREHLKRGEIRERSNAVTKAISIVTELNSSLDHTSGGEVSRNLADLYHYIAGRLFDANLKQQDGPLAEAQALLHQLAEAWRGVRAARTAAGDSKAGDPSLDETPAYVPAYDTGSAYQDAASVGHGWSA